MAPRTGDSAVRAPEPPSLMLPAAYQMPATLVLLLSGIVACFFGHRLFRVVLALFGFIIGALAASSVVGSSSSTYMLVAAVVGGLAGAGLLTAAYFVSVALLGAMLGVTVCHLTFPTLVSLMNVLLPSSWELAARQPGILVIVLFSTAGAVLSTYIQRYVIIVGTAFAGAWTLLVGAWVWQGIRLHEQRRLQGRSGCCIRSTPRLGGAGFCSCGSRLASRGVPFSSGGPAAARGA